MSLVFHLDIFCPVACSLFVSVFCLSFAHGRWLDRRSVVADTVTANSQSLQHYQKSQSTTYGHIRINNISKGTYFFFIVHSWPSAILRLRLHVLVPLDGPTDSRHDIAAVAAAAALPSRTHIWIAVVYLYQPLWSVCVLCPCSCLAFIMHMHSLRRGWGQA